MGGAQPTIVAPPHPSMTRESRRPNFRDSLSGQPHVRSQRDKWVVRIDGIDTETGNSRPRQLGTYTSKRAATRAASEFASQRDTSKPSCSD